MEEIDYDAKWFNSYIIPYFTAQVLISLACSYFEEHIKMLLYHHGFTKDQFVYKKKDKKGKEVDIPLCMEKLFSKLTKKTGKMHTKQKYKEILVNVDNFKKLRNAFVHEGAFLEAPYKEISDISYFPRVESGYNHIEITYENIKEIIDLMEQFVCMLTPGNDTWDMFLKAFRNGQPFEEAAYRSIYSNMRENLFRCLNEIDLFDYLAAKNSYWREVNQLKKSKRGYWYKIFSDEIASKECGIQLTQACNCAILRNSDSKQPTPAALNEIRRGEPGCLFNRFQFNSSLKLIIFLGTTLNLEKYWEESCYYQANVRVCSLPHPSRSNRVFNNGDIFMPPSENDSTQLRNAKNRLREAKQLMNELRNEY